MPQPSTLNSGELSFFHLPAWPRVLADSYRHRPIALPVTEDPPNPSHVSHSALLPLLEVSSPLTGKRGVSLPFADFCSTLAPDTQSALRLQEAASHEGQIRNWKYLELRGPCYLPGAQPSLEFHSHIIDLTGGPDAVLGRCEPSVRRAIRKAQAAEPNLEIRIGRTLEDMHAFYDLHGLTRKRHGLPPQPMEFFENIVRHIFEIRAGFAVIALQAGKPIAANIFFHHGREAIYKYGASNFDYQHLRPSNLVMWEGIKACAEQGTEYLHLGRTSLANEGLRRFKLSFGAREERLQYFRYHYRKAAFVKDTDRSETWLNNIFSRMPPALLRFCGRMLYPHCS